MFISTDPTGGSSSWALSSPPPISPNFVSCPSTGLCVAVSSSGYAASGRPEAAKSWKSLDVDGSYSLDGISCPSPTLCVAVDGAGDVVTSIDPAGPTTSWTVHHVDGSYSPRRHLVPVAEPLWR
jgi:hypothetical protein